MGNAQAEGRAIDRLLAEYGESHQNPTNKLIHWICVPVIAWTVLALAWSVPVPGPLAAIAWFNWASLIVVLAVIYYLFLSPPLAAGMIVFSAVSLWLVRLIDAAAPWPVWQVALALFVIAWIGQFVGHRIEGRKPSFFKDVQFLLIGPAWLMHFLYRKAGVPY